MEPRRSPLTSSGPACAASQALRLAPLQCQSIWLLIRMFLPVLFPHPAVVQATGCPSRAPLARWFRLPPRHAGRLDLPCWRRPVMLPRQTPFGRRQCCSRHFSSILQLSRHHVACRHSVWIQPYPPAAFSTRPKTLLELLPPVPLWPGPSFALTQVDWLDCDLSLPLASSHAPPELKQRLATLPRWHDHPRAAEVYQLLVYTDGSATPGQPGPTPCGVGLCGLGRCPGSVSLCWLQFTSGYANRLRIILWRMPGHTARGRTVGTCMGYGLDMGFGSCIRS